MFGGPFIANPSANWPPFAERVAQLIPLQGLGIWTIPANALRYIGWFGEQGVQLFLIASGFGLTWGLLHRTDPYRSFALGKFYLRRAERIFPLWWGAHLLFAATWLLAGWGIQPTEPSFFLSLLGIRFTPALFYYFSPAWWYFGLLVQLYLVYPLLWAGLRRLGPLRLLLITCACAFLARGIGLYAFGSYLGPWQRGAFFVTRLPEFAFGISLAAWIFSAPEQAERRLRAPTTILAAVLTYALGIALSLTLGGMIAAPFLLGVSAFIALYAVLATTSQRVSSRVLQPGLWTGQHSYSLYLVHHPWVMLLVPTSLGSPLRILGGVAAAAALTLISALILEWGVALVTRWLRCPWRAGSIVPALVRLAAIVAAIAILLIGSELLVQRFAPQEVLGWGERPALEPDEQLGWHLIPGQTTRLHWQGYDYFVTANSLGFPGPKYPEKKDPQTLRILVTGDAFTSAEGVNTEEAWPRLLEKKLAAELDRPVEVLNFAVTGYGPNQYADVIEKYAPIYRPNVIIVETFINDLREVLYSNAYRQQVIGFGSPAPDSLYATLHLQHLRRFLRTNLIEPLKELLRNRPSAEGYFLGHFGDLERGEAETEKLGEQKMADQLGRMKITANESGAKLLMIMAPAATQVCSPEQIAYYPRNVDLTDTSKFDVDMPQRLMGQAADSKGVPFYDLRPVMKAAPDGCPYQTHNMHWTKSGHEATAAYLAAVLADTLQIP